MTLQEIVTRLSDYRIKRNGDGKYQSLCPAHKDNMPSLSIGQGLGGKILLNCFAGCKTEDIAAAIGLRMTDLFDGKDETARETLPPDAWPVTSTYVYEDAAGDPVYRVLRKTSPDSGKKTFRQERAIGRDKWFPSMDGVERVLYRMPAIIASDPDTVYVVEGEKDADRLASLGFVATTLAGGANAKWLPGYSEALRGRDVVVIPDNDPPGAEHADKVMAALNGIAKSCYRLVVPGGPKSDVSDWLNGGGTADKLRLLTRGAMGASVAFQTSAERIDGERAERIEAGARKLSFGVRFLDDALGGIMPTDLVILGAKTGLGKTSLATIVSLANANRGKRVHFFALEAEEREIERRMKYELIADLYYRHSISPRRIRYLDWYQGALDDELGIFDSEAEKQMKAMSRNLNTFYRSDDFTGQDFCDQLNRIKDDTDLVVLDHFHFVDSAEENENRAFKKTAKMIRDTALKLKKPILVVAHVRKTDRRSGFLIPDADDFHGSSDVPKMATKIVMIAQDFETQTGSSALWSTYMQIAKCRSDGSLNRYAARVDFNSRKGVYQETYQLGRIVDGGRAFEEIPQAEWPSWKGNANAGGDTVDWRDVQ